MRNIHNIIEIKRGLHKTCGRDIVNEIAKLDQCEDFYRELFVIYGLIYNTETIQQKRTFIAAITKYFILDRLPDDCIYISEEKYEVGTTKGLKELLENVIEVFYQIRKSSNSNEDFKKNYAEHFNEDIKDFSKEISENRDDSLSDFAKVIQKVYHSKDENDKC